MQRKSENTGSQLDVAALYAALDSKRRTLELSWRQVATEAGVSPSTLTRTGQGKRPDVDSFAALVQWLGTSADRFLQVADATTSQDTMTVLSTHLRASKDLTPKSARALEDIIRAAFAGLKAMDDDG